MKVYVVGSLRETAPIFDVEDILTENGHEPFTQWHAAGPAADDLWQAHFKARGYTLARALQTEFVQNIVDFDKRNIMASEAVVLAMPAGKSAHIELTWAYLHGKRCVVYMPKEVERWDAMYALLPDLVIAHTEDQLIEALQYEYPVYSGPKDAGDVC